MAVRDPANIFDMLADKRGSIEELQELEEAPLTREETVQSCLNYELEVWMCGCVDMWMCCVNDAN